MRLAARRPVPDPAAPPRRPTSLLLVGVELRPPDVDAALVSLTTVATRLRALRDPRAVFADVYAVITRDVAAALRVGGTFLEPGWIATLAGRFAERYFDALAPALVGAAPAADAWRIAFAAGERGRCVPVREALLGINAHVNHDLARGVAETIAERGPAGAVALARYAHDHHAIDGVLRAAVPEIHRMLVDRYRCPASWLAARSRRGARAATEPVVRTVEAWRARVWARALALLEGDAEERRVTLRASDREAARIARALAATNPRWIAGAGARRQGSERAEGAGAR